MMFVEYFGTAFVSTLVMLACSQNCHAHVVHVFFVALSWVYGLGP